MASPAKTSGKYAPPAGKNMRDKAKTLFPVAKGATMKTIHVSLTYDKTILLYVKASLTVDLMTLLPDIAAMLVNLMTM
jgi:hypothetical protein